MDLLPENTIQFLTTELRWLRGFEAGMVYALMTMRCPEIAGAYYRLNEEQLFVMAGKMGYVWTWAPIDGDKTTIHFALRELVDE